ncbi:MAG: EAL domain-containing protein [Gammaproteobacteria bacterium]|nr:EAL domain-containing protein [Gammaproteobacteria bacterium]
MTVAGKVNAFTIIIAVAAAVGLGAVAIYKEYVFSKEQLIERAYYQIRSKPHLPVAIFNRNATQQTIVLKELLLQSRAIRFAAVLDPSGALLSQSHQPGSEAYPMPSLYQLRDNASLTQNSLVSRATDVTPADYGWLASVIKTDQLWDLTVPVLSLVNPQRKDLTAADFGAALATAAEGRSLYVLGYVHLGISRGMVWMTLLPQIATILAAMFGFIVFCSILSFVVTRRITAPFSAIVRMAEDIAQGREVRTKGLEKNAEFKDLVALLNSIIGDFKNRTTKMEVDQQLLSMKVMERTSQLSRRNKELNKAVKEVTETKNRLHKLAYYDSLTALPNRRLFTEQLDLLLRLAKRKGETIGLLFLDLDNFKRINDSLGHSAGDLLLREVAKRLARCIRDSDLLGYNVESNSAIGVSRLGGDEFTVVLNQLTDANAAGIVAERILKVLREPITLEGHEMVVTPTIGIAIAPDDANTVEGLLKAADTAMYHAKAAGKNKFVQFNTEMDASGVERLDLENDLRKAIERDELVLHYQPQVDTLTGSVVGAEALMRWQHPERGLVPPFKFIPLAEEMGLIGALGEWGLERACQQMVELQMQSLNLPKVSVNVSALQFTPGFIDRVTEVLRKTGMRPARLELELTEGIMMDGADATLQAIQKLKKLGVKLSIDDFGTGYSSLNYLSRFPLDELKIDRSFVVGMENNKNDANLVIAIIAMARSMQLYLVAEGVETQEQYQFLQQHGATVIQGYMFSKPVPLDELKPMLAPGYFKEQIASMKRPGLSASIAEVPAR